VGSALLSRIFAVYWPSLPFMDRVGLVFVICLMAAIVISLLGKPPAAQLKVELKQIDYGTSTGFNLAALGVTVILAALYITYW